MSSRSLNKVTLIGNLTRDPELRYTANGTAVCSIGLATNRSWTTDAGEKKEETEFHKIVAWNKLAELCSQLLTKGRKVYVEGRLQTRSWIGQDGAQRTTTEIVIDDMIILDPRRPVDETMGANRPMSYANRSPVSQPAAMPVPRPIPPAPLPVVEKPVISVPVTTETAGQPISVSPATVSDDTKPKKKKIKAAEKVTKEPEPTKSNGEVKEDINPDDIPF